MKIRSQEDLEEAINHYGILPFFRNNVKRLSIEEMAPPSIIFGGNEFDGCWEWKGPIIRKRNSIYGKFFRKKAGYVSKALMPHFLNWRRSQFVMREGEKEEMIYDIISINDKITSTELREHIFGASRNHKRTMFDLPELESSGQIFPEKNKPSRHTLESPLQKLQMGSYICISDFKYKQTKKGEKYGWGVAEYTLLENIFSPEDLIVDISPEDSLEYMVKFISERFDLNKAGEIKKLLEK